MISQRARSTPHRGTAALTKAALSVLPLALAGALAAGCSSSSPTPDKTSGGALPQVSGPVGQKATITLPSGATAPTKLETKTLVQGSGAALANGQLAAVNYTVGSYPQAVALGRRRRT